MPTRSTPPRITVLFARDAFEAVIFRRGPSRWFQLIRWNTRHDQFHDGAWIRGRIYPERCDLSPDGRLLLYFVLQPQKGFTSYGDSWTGVSRAPWLTALGLWREGGTWGGGGRFLDNRTIALYSNMGDMAAHPDHPGVGLTLSRDDSIRRRKPQKELPDAEWSGRDQQNRLVYAKDGRLILRNKADGTQDVCLVDLNDRMPDPQPAPKWATRPLVD